MSLLLVSVAVVSMLVAAVIAMAAWRSSRHEQARRAARVAALVAAADAPLPSEASLAESVATDTAGTPLFTTANRSSQRVLDRRLPLAAAGAGALLLMAVFTLIGRNTEDVAVARAVAPLELKVMQHERRGTQLTITGVLFNPRSGTEAAGLEALVSLLDAEGQTVSRHQLPVNAHDLSPGRTSTFAITVDAPERVARYRVGFRNSRGGVSHIDRRTAASPSAPGVQAVSQNASRVR